MLYFLGPGPILGYCPPPPGRGDRWQQRAPLQLRALVFTPGDLRSMAQPEARRPTLHLRTTARSGPLTGRRHGQPGELTLEEFC